jgi:alanine dehydrogenase
MVESPQKFLFLLKWMPSMKISVLRETKEREGRVALTPFQARVLARHGHEVFVQKNAGVLSGFSNADYFRAGAKVESKPVRLIRQTDLVLKVKEPTVGEVNLMKPGQMVFSYLHLAAVPQIFTAILRRRIIALAYETVQLSNGSLPLLAPMSEIAGKLSAQNGAHLLRMDQGGRGILLGGTRLVSPAHVVVLGAGMVGENAATIASGMGAITHVVDVSRARLIKLKKKLGSRCHIYASTRTNISKLVCRADLLIGAVLIPGAKAPKLVSKNLVKRMKKGSVIIDVAVDQGGCVETSEVTSHANPVVVKYGVLHYGVPNIPAVVPVTATQALTQVTFPYILKLANEGLDGCLKKYPEMKKAVNCAWGKVVHPGLKRI